MLYARMLIVAILCFVLLPRLQAAQPDFPPDREEEASACSDALSRPVPENVRIEQTLARKEIYFYGEAANVYNAGVAARIVNGTVILPGQVFSFNGTVGERRKDKGFIIGKDIDHNDVYGGGVCRAATVLFQTARAAGLEIVERHPHGKPVAYAKRGTDATVSFGSLDLKFANNTPCALSIYAGLERKNGARVLWSVMKERRDLKRVDVFAAKAPPDLLVGLSEEEVHTYALVADGVSYISTDQLGAVYGFDYLTENQEEGVMRVKINYKQSITFTEGIASAGLDNATVHLPGKPFSLPEYSGLWVPMRTWAELTGSEIAWKKRFGSDSPCILLKFKQVNY